MDDASRMGFLQRFRHLCRELEGLLQGQWAPRQPVFQAFTFDVLHDDERSALDLVGLVNDADVRVIEGGGGLGFTQEAFTGDRVAQHFLREELYGDVALQRRVLCQKDFTHPSLADFADDPVVGETLAEVGHDSLHRRIGAEGYLKRFVTIIVHGLASPIGKSPVPDPRLLRYPVENPGPPGIPPRSPVIDRSERGR